MTSSTIATARLPIERGQVRLLSRPGNGATRRFAPVAGVAYQTVKSATLDGAVATSGADMVIGMEPKGSV
jgi:hypothetical protein